jgi:hypothetical protein
VSVFLEMGASIPTAAQLITLGFDLPESIAIM